MQVELAFLKHLRGVTVPVPEVFQQEWINAILTIEERTRHDVAAFVEWLEAYCRPIIGEEARYIHYGLTSSDILDTTFSIQLRDSNKVIGRLLVKGVCHTLEDLMNKHLNTEMVGRTHGQAAEKIKLGHKFVAYMQALRRVRPVFYSSYDVWGKTKDIGRLCGAVGDNKYFNPMVEVKALEDLGLSSSRLNDGQIINRAYYATHMNEWAVTASIIAKIATDIRLLAITEVGEVREGRSKGQMGSSSMPQKRNPIGSENLCGLARVVRGYQTTAMQDIELWLERDISHSSAERIIFPDAAVILGYMLTRLDSILKTLDVDTVAIRNNLTDVFGSMSAQEKMLKLIDSGLSRREAHEEMRKQSGLE